MNEQDRQTIVILQFSKAQKFLMQAEEMNQLKHWDLAANRVYYSCFHAVQALFVQDGFSGHTHSGMITQFNLHYVKTSKVEVTKASFLARMFQLRQKADYNCAYEISEDEIKEILPLAKSFIATIETLLSKKDMQE